MNATLRPMVFVAMPFGRKKDARGVEIDFDAIFRDGIQPAVAGLNVDLIRADQERGGGIVHLPMFERLLISEIAIVDVTIENANVFYELGVRHTARPRSTIIMRAHGTQMPFDIKLIRALIYNLENGVLTPQSAKALNAALAEQLAHAMRELDEKSDSPLFQLIPEYKGMIDLPHAVTENFRDRAMMVNGIRERLLAAGSLTPEQAIGAINAVANELGPITSVNAESAADVMIAYRDVEGYHEMIEFIDGMPESLREHNQVIREQLALALNRRKREGDRDRAIAILDAIVKERGDNPETCGIIGRIYKDCYREAMAADDEFAAPGFLQKAIEWYERGFTSDPRDFYPGINLLTCLATKGGAEVEDQMRRTAAALSFALARQGAIKSRDYWTLATLVEASVHDNDWNMANNAMAALVTTKPKPQQLRTTRDNLGLIAKAIADGKLSHIDAAPLDRIIAAFNKRLPAPKPAETDSSSQQPPG